ncbi:MAG: glutamate synthase subunit alpha, partial [Burkholderiales bacterium]
MSEIAQSHWPKQGLYDPAFERDACGVGFVANIRGEKSHDVVEKGVRVLEKLEHRGACGCDPDSGDGAGLLVQIPDAFLRRELAKQSLALPASGQYAVAMAFVSQDSAAAARQAALFEQAVVAEGQRVLGWREVPTRPDTIGRLARAAAPRVRQLFIAAQAAAAIDQDAFERKL